MKTLCEAKLIAYSIPDTTCLHTTPIATFQLTYWRPIHPQVMTHRVFSRNAGSSRARPTLNSVIKSLEEDDIWGPISWGTNQPGMQAGEELSLEDRMLAEDIWYEAAADAIRHAKRLTELKVHKEVTNRLVEPFCGIDVVITSTDFDNFFNLRVHEATQPSMQNIAESMLNLLKTTTPTVLMAGEWHLPYITEEERNTYDLETLKKLSVARCARTSYKLFDGTNSTVKQDTTRYEDLKKDKHMSPFEHQAQCITNQYRAVKSNNLTNWFQLRQMIEAN